jgi:hypothetical protein
VAKDAFLFFQGRKQQKQQENVNNTKNVKNNRSEV